jgi:DNA-binding transcriptional ArsR family regulator
MKIIRLLSTRPWYVNELAEELGLSAASISYHVSMLTMLNIVTLEKSNQKAYYSLNKDRLNELFEEAKGIILNE